MTSRFACHLLLPLLPLCDRLCGEKQCCSDNMFVVAAPDVRVLPCFKHSASCLAVLC
jgi:hypothetical protein